MTTPPARVWHGLALLALCAAYLEGGLTKLMDFDGAVAEMQHFGLQPPRLLAVAVIALELGASALILSGRGRWLGAVALGVFTVAASVIANDFWALDGLARTAASHAFFEHLGLAGGFALVAWHDLQRGPQRP
jgi:uncharacterized membrane protein YphA (DoxX/SURF4 family)